MVFKTSGGGIFPCNHRSRPTSGGGIMPCRTYEEEDFLEGIGFTHLNPIQDPEQLQKILSKIEENGEYLGKGSLNLDYTFNKSLDKSPMIKIGRIVENIFKGGMYVKEEDMLESSVDEYRIAKIPGLPEVEMATFTFPCKPSIYFSELSLDILLVSNEEDAKTRISLRVPVVKDFNRTPMEQINKKGHLFVVSYNNIGERSEHVRSYSSEHNLERGIKRAIKKYSK